MTTYCLCKTGSLAVFNVTARDQDHYKGPSGAFVTYCNISCLLLSFVENGLMFHVNPLPSNEKIFKTVTSCSCDWLLLLFYVHGKTGKIMSGRSVDLTTLFLGRFRPPKAS